jgi:hypothetical protein
LSSISFAPTVDARGPVVAGVAVGGLFAPENERRTQIFGVVTPAVQFQSRLDSLKGPGVRIRDTRRPHAKRLIGALEIRATGRSDAR